MYYILVWFYVSGLNILQLEDKDWANEYFKKLNKKKKNQAHKN